MARNRNIPVYVNEKEYTDISHCASTLDLSHMAFIRFAINKEVARIKNRKNPWDLLAQMLKHSAYDELHNIYTFVMTPDLYNDIQEHVNVNKTKDNNPIP